MNELLSNIYYDPSHPAGLSSAQQLAKASGVSLKKVQAWLKAQPTYTLHRAARKKYPTRSYIVHDIDEQWQADLADVALIARQNKGYTFILTVIDLFSRYAWARPLKSKRGKEVAAAFEDIFKEGRIPKRIQTDQGKEFENRDVQALFQNHNIELFSVKSAYKAAVVERFNRTLKTKLWRYFTVNMNEKWVDVLPKVLVSYNNSKHRSIGCKPSEVNSSNVAEIRDKMLTTNQKKKIKEKDDINVGDKVRISKVKSVFAKGYLANWTEEIFTVESINRKHIPITYKLKDYQGEVIEGSFYRHEIQSIVHTEDIYLVEKIIRRQKRGHEQWYFVKWRGYPSSMNSWVRQRDIEHVSDRRRI